MWAANFNQLLKPGNRGFLLDLIVFVLNLVLMTALATRFAVIAQQASLESGSVATNTGVDSFIFRFVGGVCFDRLFERNFFGGLAKPGDESLVNACRHC
jgi:hypothetical protein